MKIVCFDAPLMTYPSQMHPSARTHTQEQHTQHVKPRVRNLFSKHNKTFSDCHNLFMAVRKRFAGDPTQLAQVLAAHITSPTCIENFADRKLAEAHRKSRRSALGPSRVVAGIDSLPLDHDGCIA